MHHLFRLVLGQRDLSRAGDLFSLEDAEIEDCLSEALEEIKAISCSPDYLTNDNDQAVVEICITRITTAIRETHSIERHGAALVSLWESCLEHNLQPQGKDEDTPHAKIASDITSCILQNYNQPPVMALAVPVAVKFLQRGNKELSRNMSSYLSLAAIAKAELLAEHTEAITCSVLRGNHMLLRVLPSVYKKQPEAIHLHIGELTAMMPQLEQPEQQHLLRLLQMVAKQHPLVLSSLVPSLVGYLSDPVLNDSVLTVLVDVSLASPASLSSFLPTLRGIGQQFPALLGHVAKIHGAVGLTNEEQAHSSLVYLVSLLASMEHSIHHTLLLEIRGLTDRFSSILGGCGKDIYRMSNSFTAIARLLGRRLEADSTTARAEHEMEQCPKPCDLEPGAGDADENEKLQVKIQAFEEKMGGEGESEREGEGGPQRRYSLGQAAREERREMRFNRSKSLALHAVRSRSINSENGQDGEAGELNPDTLLFEGSPSPENGVLTDGTSVTAEETAQEGPVPPSKPHAPTEMPQDPCLDEQGQTDRGSLQERDRLWVHLRDNEEKIRAFCADIIKRIPVPEQCVVEDSSRGCVVKLSFSCPLKGHYCLYGKSSFQLSSRQPHLWIHIMLLSQQSKASEPLSSEDKVVQLLKVLWEKTQIKGLHSFETAMIQAGFPHKKDLDSLQVHLEEVRFFDLFGYSEEAGGWLCFMCNNPEKATVVNQEGQPLIEGKLKEKQVRWKFIKRWKTRYFTLAGNQLLFRKGKSKDELGDSPIELSKVQSVKVVAKKRRDRSLPRAFEIFTDSKTYVLKAQDEKHTEEWLQCINVAVAQAKERENREATTYL
ncbi:ventricular zone-expressed PH domain-containing protein [Megalops cyprinoides]|uniref:ventricular zone-expressed PH domain-containing protein n=1 Tax=Megalops cyprinoides TaxID=118141 RepID=UPI001865521D|nr:ventricular zone-expressed PH domain-containing protein [Megalops cyprinoides]